MNSWSEAQIKDLAAKGKIRSYKSGKKYSTKSRKNIPELKKPSKEKDWLQWNLSFWANENSLTLESEYKFHAERKWRFDWAFPAIKVGIEYEGIFSAKSRHTTISGYTGDVEKYNTAVLDGWKVIRVTAKDYKDVIRMLNKLCTC